MITVSNFQNFKHFSRNAYDFVNFNASWENIFRRRCCKPLEFYFNADEREKILQLFNKILSFENNDTAKIFEKYIILKNNCKKY